MVSELARADSFAAGVSICSPGQGCHRVLPLVQTFAEKLLALRHQLSDATAKEASLFGTILQRAKSGGALLTAEKAPAAALASPRRGIGALLRRAVAIQKAAANFGAAAGPKSVSAATTGAASSAHSSTAGRSEASSSTADTDRLLPGHMDSSPPSAASPRSACVADEVTSPPAEHPPAATAVAPGTPMLPAQAGADAETGLPLLHQAAAPGSASTPAEPAGLASGGDQSVPAPSQAPAAAPLDSAQQLELLGDRARATRDLESALSIDDWGPEQVHTLLRSAAGSQQEAEQPVASAGAALIQGAEFLSPQKSEESSVSRAEMEGQIIPSQVVLEHRLSNDGPAMGRTSPTGVEATEPVRRPGVLVPVLSIDRPASPPDAAPGVAPGLEGDDHLGEASAVLLDGSNSLSEGAPQSAQAPGTARGQPSGAPASVRSQHRTATGMVQPAGSGDEDSPRSMAPASARGSKASATARGALRPGSANGGGPALLRQAPPAWPQAATVSLRPARPQTPRLQGEGAAPEQLSARAAVEQQAPAATQMQGQSSKSVPVRKGAPLNGGPAALPKPQLPAAGPAAPGSTMLATSDRRPAASAASGPQPAGKEPAGSEHAAKAGAGRQAGAAPTVGPLEQAVRLPRLKLLQVPSGGPSIEHCSFRCHHPVWSLNVWSGLASGQKAL